MSQPSFYSHQSKYSLFVPEAGLDRNLRMDRDYVLMN